MVSHVQEEGSRTAPLVYWVIVGQELSSLYGYLPLAQGKLETAFSLGWFQFVK